MKQDLQAEMQLNERQNSNFFFNTPMVKGILYVRGIYDGVQRLYEHSQLALAITSNFYRGKQKIN